MILYIKVGSITNAQRGVRLLKMQGYKAQIKRLENPSKADGCGYSVVVNAKNDAPIKALEKSGIEVRGVEHKK